MSDQPAKRDPRKAYCPYPCCEAPVSLGDWIIPCSEHRSVYSAAPALLAALKAANVRRDPRHRVSMLVNDWQRIEAAIARTEAWQRIEDAIAKAEANS